MARQQVRRASTILVAACLLSVLAACSTTPIPPTYTAEELAWKCTRTGGMWRPEIIGGYCEYQAPTFP
jgi:hypothetical protein